MEKMNWIFMSGTNWTVLLQRLESIIRSIDLPQCFNNFEPNNLVCFVVLLANIDIFGHLQACMQHHAKKKKRCTVTDVTVLMCTRENFAF